MESGQVSNDLPVIEPVPIFDEFCTDLFRVEDAEMGMRFLLGARQTFYETGETVLVLRRKILMPYRAVIPAIGKTAEFMARRAVTALSDNVVMFRR